MRPVLDHLSGLTRPRLLVRAARCGTATYRRDAHLTRLLGLTRIPRSGEALMRLAELEQGLNEQRLSEDAGYAFARHVDVLIAIVAEARLLRAERSAPLHVVPKAG